MKPTLHLFAPALLLLAACVSGKPVTAPAEPEQATPAPQATEPVAQAQKPDEGEAKSKAKELEQKRFDLECKRSELKIERMERESSARNAREAVEDAEQRRAKAAATLENFNKVEKPHQLAHLDLQLERSSQRFKEQQEELNELLAMYKNEDFADLTKELVVNRAKAALAFAERDLALDKQEAENKKSHDLAWKQKGLEQDLVEAERGLRGAKESEERSKLKAQLEARKSEREIDQLERDIAELEKKNESKDQKGEGKEKKDESKEKKK
jgi:hypothetical protein